MSDLEKRIMKWRSEQEMVDDNLVSCWESRHLLNQAPPPLEKSARDSLAKYVINGHARYLHRERGRWVIRDDVLEIAKNDIGQFDGINIHFPNNCKCFCIVTFTVLLSTFAFATGELLPEGDETRARAERAKAILDGSFRNVAKVLPGT